MDIYIELFIIIVLMLIFVFWRIWYQRSQKKLLKQYKPENDKSRKGGVFEDARIGKAEPGIDDTTINSGGLDQPERRELLSEADAGAVREDSNSTGKDSSSPGRTNARRLFKRRNKK